MKYNKLFNILILTISILTINNAYIQVQAATPTTVSKEKASNINYTKVLPLSVVSSPSNYLNKNIQFDAEFVGYSSLGLDYKPAYREASKYISILIRRDDVKTNTIPLSEMKIFIKREVAEKHLDLEQGDKILISGKVFSTALGDPWVDVEDFKILETKAKENK